MKQYKSFVFVNFLAIAFLSLNGCGAGDTTAGIIDDDNSIVKNTNHPIFSRLTISASPSYSPSGNTADTTPTFSWNAIANASEYQFGHEITDTADDWQEYRVSASQANCDGANKDCAYTPDNYTFLLNEERAWWVRAKVSGSWQPWSNSHVFTIVQTPNAGGDIPQKIAPMGDVTDTNPEFSWTAVTNASSYQIGYENNHTWDEWTTHTVSADQSGCLNATQNCAYTPTANFSKGDHKRWWVRALLNGAWGDWSEGSDISIVSNSVGKRPFMMKVRTNSVGKHPDTQFEITVVAGSNYNYSVDCDSDGVVEASGVTGNYLCDYATPGDYTISISGEFPHMSFLRYRVIPGRKGSRTVYYSDSTKILSIEQWGTQKWSSMENAFRGASQMEMRATDMPDLSEVSSMKNMFSYAHKFNQDISTWDVSHVTNMSGMFSMAYAFNQDISAWDVSHVTDMKSLFSGARSYNQDIGSWDVSQVKNMVRMFYGTKSFDQDISTWDVSHTTNMASMFDGASAFNQDIGNWDTTNVTNMSYMFRTAEAFNQDIGAWNTAQVTNMSHMFFYAKRFNQDVGNWDTSNVNDMSQMFNHAEGFNQNISRWDISKKHTCFGR